MTNKVQHTKEKRGPKPLYLILFIIIIVLVSILVNAAIRRSLDQNEEAILAIQRLEGQAYQLSALEWEAIGERATSPEVMESVDATLWEIQTILTELEQRDPNNIQPVREGFSFYISALEEEFQLISAGDYEQAKEVDEETTDPAFEKLAELLTSTRVNYDTKLAQVKQQSNLGFNFLLFFIVATMTVAFWQFQRIQASFEQEHLDELNAINLELESNQRLLEHRVDERTADLERRASQMETVSSVARSISAVRDLDQLLPTICEVVSDQFGFYHTGVFLIDDRDEYAILQAANSSGGLAMLKRGHRLRVGATGIVGTVAGQGKAHIALNVEADAAYFNNPDLPETRSEMALPLKVGSQTVGVLDVQSRELDAFKEEDVAVLGILANQVSIAIENARLFSQTKQSLADSQSNYQQFIKQDWARFSHAVKHAGYIYNGIKAAPIEETSPSAQSNAVNVPIKIRGLPIGNITIQSNNPLRAWSQGEIDLARAAAERAGLAIENYRLLTEAQRRAAKERTVSEITARIGSSVDMRAIMQTAVEELGHAFSGSEVTVQFNIENK